MPPRKKRAAAGGGAGAGVAAAKVGRLTARQQEALLLQLTQEEADAGASAAPAPSEPAAATRKRGRPRKNPVKEGAEGGGEKAAAPPPTAKRRGRPRKVREPAVAAEEEKRDQGQAGDAADDDGGGDVHKNENIEEPSSSTSGDCPNEPPPCQPNDGQKEAVSTSGGEAVRDGGAEKIATAGENDMKDEKSKMGKEHALSSSSSLCVTRVADWGVGEQVVKAGGSSLAPLKELATSLQREASDPTSSPLCKITKKRKEAPSSSTDGSMSTGASQSTENQNLSAHKAVDSYLAIGRSIEQQQQKQQQSIDEPPIWQGRKRSKASPHRQKPIPKQSSWSSEVAAEGSAVRWPASNTSSNARGGGGKSQSPSLLGKADQYQGGRVYGQPRNATQSHRQDMSAPLRPQQPQQQQQQQHAQQQRETSAGETHQESISQEEFDAWSALIKTKIRDCLRLQQYTMPGFQRPTFDLPVDWSIISQGDKLVPILIDELPKDFDGSFVEKPQKWWGILQQWWGMETSESTPLQARPEGRNEGRNSWSKQKSKGSQKKGHGPRPKGGFPQDRKARKT